MHELGLTDAILKTVERIAREEKLTTVYTVTVEVGALSGVIPRFLSDCWSAVIEGTPWHETKLNIVNIPGILRCEDCGAEFSLNTDDLRCPFCEGCKLTPIAGMEMNIRDLEAI